MHKVSITTLEKFRRYQAETSSYDTEESLLESLKGEFKGNCKTMTGTAFHSIIENPRSSEITISEDGEYTLVQVSPDRDNKELKVTIGIPVLATMAGVEFHDNHPLMVYEVPIKKVYETQFGQMLVSGRADGVYGKEVHDHKTKYRALSDISDYADSCQWQYYLDILGLKKFQYNVFEFKRFKEFDPFDTSIAIHYLKGVEVVPHEPIICYSYASMHENCMYLLNEFFKWIEFRNYWHLLKKVDPVTHETIREEVQATS